MKTNTGLELTSEFASLKLILEGVTEGGSVELGSFGGFRAFWLLISLNLAFNLDVTIDLKFTGDFFSLNATLSFDLLTLGLNLAHLLNFTSSFSLSERLDLTTEFNLAGTNLKFSTDLDLSRSILKLSSVSFLDSVRRITEGVASIVLNLGSDLDLGGNCRN